MALYKNPPDYMYMKRFQYSHPIKMCSFCKEEKQHYVILEFTQFNEGCSAKIQMCEDCFDNFAKAIGQDKKDIAYEYTKYSFSNKGEK